MGFGMFYLFANFSKISFLIQMRMVDIVRHTVNVKNQVLYYKLSLYWCQLLEEQEKYLGVY